MRIAIGSDHAGFHHKEFIRAHLMNIGHEVTDFGADSDASSDYPLLIRPVAECVARGEADIGIVLGGSGNGEAIVSNKVRGIRCALCWNTQTAAWARGHNNANLLSLGARTISENEAIEIVDTFLGTRFDGGRHARRVQQIAEIEDEFVSKSRKQVD